jgi:hypothetical protein
VDNWNEYKLSINLIFRKPVFFWTPYFVSIIVTIFLVLFYGYRANSIPVWYSPKVQGGIHLAAFIQIPVYLITYYTFSLCLVSIISIYLALKKLFTYSRVSVQPLHPDNCGGLAPLGALSRKLNIGILLIGIIAGINIYKNSCMTGNDQLFTQFTILVIIIYIACAFIVFFLPLYAAHESMKTAKYEEIERINNYFMNLNFIVIECLSKNENIDENIRANFENVNKIYELAKRMPVYPFNSKTVASFFGSIFIPIILFVIERLMQHFVL